MLCRRGESLIRQRDPIAESRVPSASSPLHWHTTPFPCFQEPPARRPDRSPVLERRGAPTEPRPISISIFAYRREYCQPFSRSACSRLAPAMWGRLWQTFCPPSPPPRGTVVEPRPCRPPSCERSRKWGRTPSATLVMILHHEDAARCASRILLPSQAGAECLGA